MPYNSYGLLKAVRNHQVHSPSAAVSAATGRPDACNICHLDRSLGWSADHQQRWYGLARPPLTADQENISAAVLWSTKGDAGARALAAWMFGWPPALRASGADWPSLYLAVLLEDPYPAVRHIALRSLRRQHGFRDLRLDVDGDPAARREVSRAILRLWQARHRRVEGGGLDRGLLIGSESGLQIQLVNRLLRERDNRPVTFAE
jgi:hypothetical protein